VIEKHTYYEDIRIPGRHLFRDNAHVQLRDRLLVQAESPKGLFDALVALRDEVLMAIDRVEQEI